MLVGRCVPNANQSSALIGRCALVSRPDSTVGGKLTNHSYHFKYLLDIFHRHARQDLAAIFASMDINYFTHFRHFCFVVSICVIISDEKTASSCIQY